MEKNFKVAKLTEALVAANLSGSADPYELASVTIRRTVQVALRALPAWDPAGGLVVEEAVRGGLQALVMAELDIARGGFLTLCEMTDLAVELGRDPVDMMKSAMRGMAALSRLVPATDMERLRLAIESGNPGSGTTFHGLVNGYVNPTSPYPLAS